MTKKKMERYLECRREIEEKEEAIERTLNESYQVYIDVVRGSSPCFPYTGHPVKIEGYNDEDAKKFDVDQERRKQYRLDQLAKEKNMLIEESRNLKTAIELCLSKEEDVQTRRILRMKYIDGKTIQEITRKLGGFGSCSMIKMRIQRFFAKK